MASFVDGDDLCAGCGICCQRVEGLVLTAEELDRVPAMRPYVTRFDGTFHVVDIPDGCPYLSDDKRCQAFDRRPFDCSLFPLHVSRLERSGDAVVASWRYGGPECPNRWEFASRMGDEQWVEFRGWLKKATGASTVELRQDSRRRWRSRTQRLLHRLGLLAPLRRVAGRPLASKPAPRP